MSYFGKHFDYSHCPLKKRPFVLIDDNSDGEDQPKDLSIKRQKINIIDDCPILKQRLSQPPTKSSFKSSYSSSLPFNLTKEVPGHSLFDKCTSSTTLHSNRLDKYDSSLVPSSTTDNEKEGTRLPSGNQEIQLPSLADFYLQLFQQSTKPSNSQEHMKGAAPWAKSWSILAPCQQWSALSQSSISSSTSSPAESNLSSPRSTSSEDSGVGSEFISEDEVDFQRDFISGSSVRFSCTSCGKSYSTQSGLRKHMDMHCSSISPRAFTCIHCSKAYTTIGALKMHVRTHTLPCKCNVCGKAFSRPWLLQGHIRTHTGEKPFECQQCHRSFADRSNLRAHQQTHEKVKKYACHNCTRTFSRMSLLTKHIENACPGKLLGPNDD